MAGPAVLVSDPTSTPLGAALEQVARIRPDHPALLSPLRCLTWRELDDEVNRLAGLLVRLGVRPGDPVGVICNKRPEVVITFLACARMGAILTPVNFKLHKDRVLDQFRTTDIRCVVAEAEFDGLLEHLQPVLTDRRKVIHVGPRSAWSDTSYDETHALPATPVAFRPEPDTVCYYNYTSGTTGRPKGAVATHRAIQANALSGIEGFGFSGEDTFFGLFSVFSHPHELFHRSLLVGGPFVVVDTLSPRVVCQAIDRFRVTWMMAVPSFYEMMLDQGATEKYDLSCLRVLEAGGAWVSARTLEEMESRFRASFLPVWGSTETTGVALAMPPDRPRLPGATGRPAPRYEIRLVDDLGADVPDDTVGEMIIRSEALAQGYHNRPEETTACFRDGWYWTGDLMRRDAEGWYHFVGRRSEMMKIGGIRVYPLELEQVILSHPGVRDCVVVAHTERLRGEVARAVVTRAEGSTVEARELRNWCLERLAVYQVPRFFEFWKQIPKLPNGKIDKIAVKAEPASPGRDDG